MVKSGNISSEIILAIMKELQINQPIILNSLLDHKDLSNIIKSLSYQEYSMGFRQTQINSYQSCIIFADLLSDFKWNLTTTYAPTLVVSEIKRDTTKLLKQFAVSIGSEVIFLDLLSQKIYESYTINKIHIVRYLGVFQEKYSSGLHKNSSTVKFFPSKDFIRTMEERRRDFHGVEITSVNKVRMSSIDFSKIKNNKHNNDGDDSMYDITNLTGIPEIFYGIEPQVSDVTAIHNNAKGRGDRSFYLLFI